MGPLVSLDSLGMGRALSRVERQTESDLKIKLNPRALWVIGQSVDQAEPSLQLPDGLHDGRLSNR